VDVRDVPKIVIDDSAKEVFFQIGLTLYAAQSFEKCLLGMLYGLYVVENLPNWRENYLKETENLNSLTLGKLLAKARKSVSFGQGVDPILQLALKERNRFIHNYYEESFALLSDRRGHKKAIAELIELQKLFRKADDTIEPLSWELMKKAGMTDQQISIYAHRSMGYSSAEK
jgi:hypothetical protein